MTNASNKAGGHGQQNRPQTDYAAMTEYYDGEGRLKKEVFVEWPKLIAENLRKDRESRTSLRRFFGQLATIRFRKQMRLRKQKRLRKQMRPNEPGLIRNGIGRLHTFAQYQSGRVIKEGTKNFIHANCNAVLRDEDKFEGFFQLFQGVMAYLPRN